MRDILTSQEFGIMLTLLFYMFGVLLYKLTKFPLFNPLLVATLLLIVYIRLFQINLAAFLTDLSGIHVFLGPLIVSLAVPIVKKMDLVKRHLVPILVGSFIGALSSIGVVLLLGNWFQLDADLLASLLPKAATTPIAIEVSSGLGGIRSVTVAAVVISAIFGATIIPLIVKVLKIKNPLIIGMGLGSTSQAVGTAKAIEMNAEAGAVAGVALVFTGIFTAIIALFISII